MAELVASVKQHGIITPLTLAPDGDGFVIVAGERRYRAAKQAKLKEVPAQVRDADGDALTLAVAENVIRADLNPVEEARAYERLVAEHGDTAKVAKLVGRSEKLIGERLDLLRLPEEAQALLAARRVPLACAPALIRIAEREPLLADLCAVWLADRPSAAARFPADPGEVVDDVLEAEWQDDDGQPLHPVAYSVGGWHGPILPAAAAGTSSCRASSPSSASTASRSPPPTRSYPRSRRRTSTTGRRARPWSSASASASPSPTRTPTPPAPSAACSTCPAPDGREPPLRHRPRVARRPARAEDRRPRRRRGGAEAARARGAHADAPQDDAGEGGPAANSGSATTRHASQDARATSTSARRSPAGSQSSTPTRSSCSARSYCSTTARRQPGRTASASSSRRRRTSRARSPSATRAARRPRPSYTAKRPSALSRARTPEDALAVVLRLLVAQRLVETDGLPGADRQGVYEPQELAASTVLDKLARRVAPPRSNGTWPSRRPSASAASRHGAEQAAAKLAEQRAKLAAGEPVRCACCFEPITSPDDAAEKHGSLVHRGDCEQQWGSEIDEEEAA